MAYGTWSSGTSSTQWPTTATSIGAATWRQEENPSLVGRGPVECSSCTELSVLPDVIWDVNGYYRELGVSPRATRKDLRLAYQAKDGQNSARLTYIFRQLLNPKTRFEYDCTPLGELFFDDYVRDMLNRRMKDRLSQRMADLANVGVDLDQIDDSALARDIYAEMGLEVSDDTPAQTVDGGPGTGQDEPSPAKFEYAYYLWATRLREDPLLLSSLAEWQRFLVSALAREGVKIKFAVGLHGKPNRWVQAQVGYRTVFFLNINDVPTEDLARDVAVRVRLDREQQTPRTHREIDL